ncbi:hypothetical protein M3J09_000131 [Ascochyta lentis]
MAQLSSMSNGTNAAAGDSQAHDTVITHTDNQIALQQLTPSLSGDKTNMDWTAPETSSPPTAPGVLHALARSVATSPSVRQASSDPRQPHSDMDGDSLPELSKTTELDVPTAPATSDTKERTARQAAKRTRTESALDGVSPAPKKAVKRPRVEVVISVTKSPAKTKAPTKLDTNSKDHNAEEGGGSSVEHEIQTAAVSAESEVSFSRPKELSKIAPKKSTSISGRRRACDTCKRRKVKCKHKFAEDEVDDSSELKKETSSRKPTVKTPKVTKQSPIGERDEPVSFEASAPNAEVQREQMVDADDHSQDAEEELPKKTKAQKKAPPKKAAAPPGRISKRNRNPPERFGDPEERLPAKATPVKKSTSKVFDPVYITTNSTSRLGKADMYRMLLSDAAWSSLSADQQMTLVSMLPTTPEHQQLIGRIRAGETEGTRPWTFTLSNDCFRTDVAKFKEDLKNGHLAKTWQAAAEQAVIERAAGEYDEWKAKEAELWWGQKGK